MKVIFLDFDGVLNNLRTFSDKKRSILEPYLMKRVAKIAKATDAKIVISSAWRIGRSIHSLRALLHPWIDKNLIIDKTISIRYLSLEKRWIEIAHWLNDHHHNVDGFVILDDIEDFDILRKHHLLTRIENGIRENDIRRAIQILNSGWDVDNAYRSSQIEVVSR